MFFALTSSLFADVITYMSVSTESKIDRRLEKLEQSHIDVVNNLTKIETLASNNRFMIMCILTLQTVSIGGIIAILVLLAR